MNRKILVLAIQCTILLVTAVSICSAIQLNPSSIEETVFASKTVSVKISNDKNVSVDIHITTNIPEYVTIKPAELTIEPDSEEVVTLTLHAGDYTGKVTYHYEYTINNSTTTGEIIQNITVHYGKITISP